MPHRGPHVVLHVFPFVLSDHGGRRVYAMANEMKPFDNVLQITLCMFYVDAERN